MFRLRLEVRSLAASAFGVGTIGFPKKWPLRGLNLGEALQAGRENSHQKP